MHYNLLSGLDTTTQRGQCDGCGQFVHPSVIKIERVVVGYGISKGKTTIVVCSQECVKKARLDKERKIFTKRTHELVCAGSPPCMHPGHYTLSGVWMDEMK